MLCIFIYRNLVLFTSVLECYVQMSLSYFHFWKNWENYYQKCNTDAKSNAVNILSPTFHRSERAPSTFSLLPPCTLHWLRTRVCIEDLDTRATCRLIVTYSLVNSWCIHKCDAGADIQNITHVDSHVTSVNFCINLRPISVLWCFK